MFRRVPLGYRGGNKSVFSLVSKPSLVLASLTDMTFPASAEAMRRFISSCNSGGVTTLCVWFVMDGFRGSGLSLLSHCQCLAGKGQTPKRHQVIVGGICYRIAHFSHAFYSFLYFCMMRKNVNDADLTVPVAPSCPSSAASAVSGRPHPHRTPRRSCRVPAGADRPCRRVPAGLPSVAKNVCRVR